MLVLIFTSMEKCVSNGVLLERQNKAIIIINTSRRRGELEGAGGGGGGRVGGGGQVGGGDGGGGGGTRSGGSRGGHRNAGQESCRRLVEAFRSGHSSVCVKVVVVGGGSVQTFPCGSAQCGPK